jgi:competence protein ComEC
VGALALGIWAGIGLPPQVTIAVCAVAIGGYFTSRQRSLLLCSVGLLAGLLVGQMAEVRAAATRGAEIPEGRAVIVAVVVTDPINGSNALVKPVQLLDHDDWVAWRGPTLLLSGVPRDVMAGEIVVVDGAIERGRESFRGRAIAGTMQARSASRVGAAPNPLLALGNLMRRHLFGNLDAAAGSAPGALLTGFLIGDVSRLPDADNEALRLAGLSHFVAVSGSNVALFLAAWWIAGAPLRMGQRQRAAFGIVGIVVFALITRWEPSVVRASVMAGLVLVGRLTGRPITPFTALGGAVALSLLAAPDLSGSAGFGLSVAATAGIIIGAPLWAGRRPRPLWAVLGATISAQAAVAPLLLIWFGAIPLLAPLTNLLAAPLVAASTAIGGVGAVLHLRPLVDLGSGIAMVVLVIARTAGDLPQLDAAQTILLAMPAVLAVWITSLRPALLAIVAVVVVTSIAPVRPPEVATAHFLDVGQGDATLFIGPGGETILIDGGPDPGLLRSHLRAFGVRRIDLLIITHHHADHTTGLVGLLRTAAVGMVWYPSQLGFGSPLDDLVDGFDSAGVPALIPNPGSAVSVGAFEVVVLAPLRAYASPNDGSIVADVRWRGVSVLMAGDIETYAQSDLGPLSSDVLKVPHQGAATSDLEWLAASAPVVAIISVGSNDYGHPSDQVVDTLEEAGSLVLRTDKSGTISLPLDRFLDSATGLPSTG